MTGRERRHRLAERAFVAVCWLALAAPLALVAVCLLGVAAQAGPNLAPAATAGLWPALLGSLALVALTALCALPLGIGCALYLEEYGAGGHLARFARGCVRQLAGVPSVLYGLLALEVLVGVVGAGGGLVTGAVTMSLVVLPTIVLTCGAALRSVPAPLRDAGTALGATRWQVLRRIVLPQALPGILGGSVQALARALGEAAPLLVLGAAAQAADGVDSGLSVLPLEVFRWLWVGPSSSHANAAPTVLVLVIFVLALNALALLLRRRRPSASA